MPIFVVQGRYTREYLRGGLANPEDRHAAVARLCQEAGGRLLHYYFTFGQHDFLVITEMPDAMSASQLVLAAAGGGGVMATVTTQAFTTAEAKEMFERASKIAYKPMGAA
jgi:uncharacterized protein with GYD domain